MYTGKLIFSQVMEHLPLHVFHQCVDRYHGDFKVKEFTCLDQYLCMAFAQLTYRESLRDIEACLHAQKNKLYHMGIRASISRNTLANVNKVRDWHIYADLAQSLIPTARKLYLNDDFALDLEKFRPAYERRLKLLKFVPAFDLDAALSQARQMTGPASCGTSWQSGCTGGRPGRVAPWARR